MATTNIKGISVSIGADTKTFDRGISKMTKDIRGTTRDADLLNKALQISFDEKKFTESQRLVQQAIDGSTAKVEQLQARIKSLQDSGNLTPELFNKYNSEIIRTEANAVLLQKKLQEIAQMRFDALAAGFKQAGEMATVLGKALIPASAAAGALLGSLSKLGLDAVKTAADIQRLATTTGISAEGIQELQYIALQTNVAFTDLQKGFVKTREALADLNQGELTTGAKALLALNLSFKDFSNSEEFFYGVISALGDVGSELEQVALITDIFGAEMASKLIPLIKAGDDALAEYADEFRALGGLTNEQVEDLNSLNLTLNKIKTAFRNVALQLGHTVMPAIEGFATFLETKILPAFTKLSDAFKALDSEQLKMVLSISAVVVALSPALLIVGKLLGSVGALVTSMPKLISLMNVLSAHPVWAAIALGATLVGALAMADEELGETLSQLADVLGDALAPLLESSMNLIGALAKVVGVLFKALAPLINLALKPLLIIFEALEVVLGVVSTIFDRITGEIQKFLGFIATVAHNIIDFFNAIIDGVNSVSKHIGITIPRLKQIEMGVTQEINTTNTQTDIRQGLAGVYGSGNITNNDYHNDYRTQEVTVVVENYAQEVDVDAMVRQINLKLSEVA